MHLIFTGNVSWDPDRGYRWFALEYQKRWEQSQEDNLSSTDPAFALMTRNNDIEYREVAGLCYDPICT